MGLTPEIFHFATSDGSGGFNMPWLFNRAIERAQTPYVLCTGVDFVYDPRLIERYSHVAKPDRLLLKEVEMLPNMQIARGNVDSWTWPQTKTNPFGKKADGIQFAHMDLWKKLGGYDEKMVGWGGMDNDLHNRAERSGAQIVWVRKGRILHQWHRIEKGKSADLEQSKRNWARRDLKNRPICLNFLKFQEILNDSKVENPLHHQPLQPAGYAPDAG